MTQNTKIRIKELAESMNVSPIDTQCLMNSIVNSLQKDKMIKVYLNSTPSERKDILEAYIIDAVKKMESFTTILATNEAAEKEFSNFVLALL